MAIMIYLLFISDFYKKTSKRRNKQEKPHATLTDGKKKTEYQTGNTLMENRIIIKMCTRERSKKRPRRPGLVFGCTDCPRSVRYFVKIVSLALTRSPCYITQLWKYFSHISLFFRFLLKNMHHLTIVLQYW